MIRITLGWVFFEKSFLPNTETKGTKLSRKWLFYLLSQNYFIRFFLIYLHEFIGAELLKSGVYQFYQKFVCVKQRQNKSKQTSKQLFLKICLSDFLEFLHELKNPIYSVIFIEVSKLPSQTGCEINPCKVLLLWMNIRDYELEKVT